MALRQKLLILRLVLVFGSRHPGGDLLQRLRAGLAVDAGLHAVHAGGLRRELALGIADPGGQAADYRGVGLSLGQGQCAGGSCGSIGCNLVSNSDPGGATPPLRRVGIAGGVDPKVLSQTVGDGRRGRLNNDLALPARERGRILRSLLGSRHVAVGGGKARLQARDLLGLG